mmetsp:Transcript_27170/g.82411  ORF Transcript_27170/g.82411 Transcript_27170/m.82411 type:complete len:209 (-) Transcript_27170:122-748(-)
MGANLSTERLARLTALGFDVASCRAALDACDGDVDRAERLLREQARGARVGQGVELFGMHINSILREQRPWSEFFERFLWPEHPRERLLTNLVYYRGNYLVLVFAIILIAVLLLPKLFFTAALMCMTFTCAILLGDTPIPHVGPLELQQRLAVACIPAAWLLQTSGCVGLLAQLASVCFGLVLSHATFRARSLSSRWRFLHEQFKASE